MLGMQDITSGLGPMLQAIDGPQQGRPFTRVTIDSRQAQADDLFVALPGERHNGHDFIAHAVAGGATGVLAEHLPTGLPPDVTLFRVANSLAALQALAAYWRARHELKVIGITGSLGKTTCKELTAAVLTSAFAVLKSEANLNTEIGLPLTLLQLRPDHQRAVLEMGMYGPGEIRLLCQIARPQMGVVTNVGPIHMERLGSLEAIALAKAELVESLPPEGTAFLNGDDPLVAAMAHRTAARAMSFGSTQECDVRGSVLASAGLGGVTYSLASGDESVDVATTLPGRHNLHNVLAAAAVGLADGLPLRQVALALENADVPLRLRTVAGPNGSTIIDDTYNASPASMLAALDLLAELPGRHLALLGDMLELGSYEEEAHRLVGRQAARGLHALYVVGQRGQLIGQAAQEAGQHEVHFLRSREEAPAILRKALGRGDHLLVKASRALALETVVEELAD
ncbi:MAG TPA: UDP-N-acetylmuramoyl-tripeptide--D-alanyl-D-alanine ligase [Dehalococcoidia bacterium]|nr:UDP-N-acetylmuramoyl-tripeptide--D-alanyl-D-alanine ligase [Dehalococcoidia bacterium]